MLINFELGSRTYVVLLVNGMTFSQYIDRLLAAGVPLKAGCDTVAPAGLMARIRSATRAWEWQAVLRLVIAGDPQFPGE